MPTPIRWQVPTELSPEEARVAALLHRSGKFYVFLRAIRAELFDDAFQAELAAVYQPRGTAPLPAALLAMVTVLQAYDQVSDADAVVAARMDRRWQLVLGNLDTTAPLFSQGALVKFRERMIAHDLDRHLLDRHGGAGQGDRPVRLAGAAGGAGFLAAGGPGPRRGHVESAGPRLRTVVTCAAKTLQIPREAVLAGAGVTLLGAPSLKAALDIDWGDPAAQADALARLLAEVDRVEAWVAAHVPVAEAPTVQAALTALRRVLAQDLEPDPTTGQRRIRRGVAPDRLPSLGDPEMRHGRKTRTRPFTGYKRHVMKLVDADLIVGVERDEGYGSVVGVHNRTCSRQWYWSRALRRTHRSSEIRRRSDARPAGASIDYRAMTARRRGRSPERCGVARPCCHSKRTVHRRGPSDELRDVKGWCDAVTPSTPASCRPQHLGTAAEAQARTNHKRQSWKYWRRDYGVNAGPKSDTSAG